MSSWLRPLCCTRTGAAHLRRGRPCQDASGSHSFLDRDGATVRIMVVADGHGGPRYIHSAVGSWLACRTALRTVQQLWQPSQAIDRHHWLAVELPEAIHRRWLQAVNRHWRAQRAGDAATAGAPLLYGTTLGLVVMTPTWWGQTGLGDWDLLQVQAREAGLVGEESDPGASGEATFSLCLSNAAAHFAPRTAIQCLEPDQEAFTLLLSTDGIRKSCSTDDDFLALGRYLSGAPAQADPESVVELAASLDRISSQGSGDDVSLAIAHWRPGEPLPRQPLIPVPRLSSASKPQLHPCRAEGLLPGPAPQLPGGEHPDRARSEHSEFTTTQAKGTAPAEPMAPPAPRSSRRPRPWLVGTAVIAAGGSVALWLNNGRWAGSLPRAAPAAPQLLAGPQQVLAPVRRQVRDLCAGQLPILPTLETRRSIFTALRQRRLHPVPLLAASNRDPLAALIALSHDPGTDGLSDQPAFTGLQLCPSLKLALSQLWQHSQAATPQASPEQSATPAAQEAARSPSIPSPSRAPTAAVRRIQPAPLGDQ